jgi:uncharacterized protein YdcH (DUF465 family)
MRVVSDPPSLFIPKNTTRRGPRAHPGVRVYDQQGEVSLMELNQEELKAHLMATNDKFRELAEQHAQLQKELEAIESKPHLTLDDEHKEQQIKKQKLRLKDMMNIIMSQHKAQQVA